MMLTPQNPGDGGDNVNAIIALVRSQAPDDVRRQLSLLNLALCVGSHGAGLSKAQLLRQVDEIFDKCGLLKLTAERPGAR